MLVLGLDTSTPAVSVALVRLGEGVLAERVVVDARAHGELLARGIEQVLADAEVGRGALGAVAVGLGPGPFTGLRVGIVTAAALGDALGIPAYGVCSLDALGQGPRLAVTDARRKEVYWAAYDDEGGCVEGPAVGLPLDVAGAWPDLPIVGAGAYVHAGAFASREVLAEPRYPSAARIAELAVAGAETALTPRYLRRPDAQVPGPVKPVTG